MSDESPHDGDPDDAADGYDPIFRTDEGSSPSNPDRTPDDAAAGAESVDAAFDPVDDGDTEGGDGAAGGSDEAAAGGDGAARGADDAEELFGDESEGVDETGYELAANERYCSNCEFVIDAGVTLCPECGTRQDDEVEAGPDLTPVLSGVLSFFVPGLGQLYNGQTTRAAITFVVWVAWLAAIVFGWLLISLVTGGLALTAVIVLPVIDAVYHGIASVDAYVQAGKIDRGEIAP